VVQNYYAYGLHREQPPGAAGQFSQLGDFAAVNVGSSITRLDLVYLRLVPNLDCKLYIVYQTVVIVSPVVGDLNIYTGAISARLIHQDFGGNINAQAPAGAVTAIPIQANAVFEWLITSPAPLASANQGPYGDPAQFIAIYTWRVVTNSSAPPPNFTLDYQVIQRLTPSP